MLPAQCRPWVADRAERRRAGPWQWWSFPVGGEVRCPNCTRILSEYGAAFLASARVHPIQRQPRPTERLGAAQKCQGCQHWVDLAFVVIDTNGKHG